MARERLQVLVARAMPGSLAKPDTVTISAPATTAVPSLMLNLLILQRQCSPEQPRGRPLFDLAAAIACWVD